MMRQRLAGTLVVSMALVASVTPQGRAEVNEPRSGIAFPVRLVPPGGRAAQQLVGTAVRVKTIFRIKVYALGLYVDPEAARTALSTFAGRPRATLERDASFFAVLLQMKFGMTLRLVMARNVGGKEVAEAFDDALRPRLSQAEASGMPGGEVALAQFRRHFDSQEVSKGTEVVFSCRPGGRFETTVGGARRPTIESPALCWALFDVYLGEKPISTDVRRHLVGGFPEVLVVRGAAAAWAPYQYGDRATSARGLDADRRSVPARPASSCSES